MLIIKNSVVLLALPRILTLIPFLLALKEYDHEHKNNINLCPSCRSLAGPFSNVGRNSSKSIKSVSRTRGLPNWQRGSIVKSSSNRFSPIGLWYIVVFSMIRYDFYCKGKTLSGNIKQNININKLIYGTSLNLFMVFCLKCVSTFQTLVLSLYIFFLLKCILAQCNFLGLVEVHIRKKDSL